MNNGDFIDYYDLLQLSSNADTETIERVFRHFAKKYHPDNKDTGNADRFRSIVEAYRTLSNPENRAGYDVKHQEHWNTKWGIASEASNRSGFEGGNGFDVGDDQTQRSNILSILYLERRRNMKKPGVGDYELARLLSIPIELVEFHVWYLKSKGFIERLDTGQVAISASGVDEVEQGQATIRKTHMLMSGAVTQHSAEASAGTK